MKKFFAVFLLVLIFPLIFLSLMGLGFRQTFYKPEFIKSELVKFKVYDKVSANLPEIVKSIAAPKEGSEPKVSETPSPFTLNETIALAQKILTPTEMQGITEAAINGAWPWFFNSPQAPPAETSIATIKQKAEVEMINTFRQKYEALPICRTISAFSGDIFGANACRPRGVTFDMLKAQYEAELGMPITFLGAFPDNLNPEQIIQSDSGMQKTYNTLKPFQPVFATGRYLVFVWPAILLVAAFFLARLFAGSWAKTATTAGIFYAAIGGLSYLIGIWFFEFIQSQLAFWEGKIPLSQFVVSEIISPLRADLIAQTHSRFNLIALGLIGLGVTITAVSQLIIYLIDKHDQKSGWSLKKKKV